MKYQIQKTKKRKQLKNNSVSKETKSFGDVYIYDLCVYRSFHEMLTSDRNVTFNESVKPNGRTGWYAKLDHTSNLFPCN